MNCKPITILLLFLYSSLAISQQEIIDSYVATAIQNNISLQKEQLNYKKSQLRLKEINRKYIPDLSFRARFSKAVGGRVFEVPLGDFLNPIYQGLNELSNSVQTIDPSLNGFSGLSNIRNDQFYFLRRTEQETFLRLAFPILNFNLLHARRLQQYRNEIEEKGLQLDKKLLAYEVRKNYFNYLKIFQLQVILNLSRQLVDDNLETAKSLVEHHKATKDYIYSVETEVKSVEKEIAEVNSQEHLTKAYFNLLLNRPIEEEIIIAEGLLEPSSLNYSLKEALVFGLKNRLELNQMDIAASLADQKIKYRKSNRLPELNFVGIYGFQGTKYEFGERDDFGVGSLVLSWDLWNPETGPVVEQAKVDKEILSHQRRSLEQKIQMEILTAYYEIERVQKSISLTKAEQVSAEQNYRLVNKKFKQGQANVTELSQARTQLIQIEKEIVILKYDLEVKLLDFKIAIGQ